MRSCSLRQAETARQGMACRPRRFINAALPVTVTGPFAARQCVASGLLPGFSLLSAGAGLWVPHVPTRTERASTRFAPVVPLLRLVARRERSPAGEVSHDDENAVDLRFDDLCGQQRNGGNA